MVYLKNKVMKIARTLCLLFFLVLSAKSFVFAGESVEDNWQNNAKNYKHFGIIVSGPSGAGKTTIVEKLLKKHPELAFSVSATTRMPRKGEKNGVSYYFLDRLKFEELVEKDEFIEYAENFGNYYGSPKRNYIEAVKNNKDVVFVLSADGMENAVKNKKMDFVTIFINVSSDTKLMERLKLRATESEEQMKKRLASVKYEQSKMKKYDYIVDNDDIEYAVKNVEAIYLAEKFKRMDVKKKF